MNTYAGEPLNILHTIGLDHLYPVVRCQIDFDSELDKPRFIDALTAVTKIVPQILCRYVMKTNSWEQLTNNVNDLIFDNVDQVDDDAASWDLMNEPQLRIYYTVKDHKTQLVVYISHILSDGAGSKQLLYLLAQAYSNGPESISSIQNNQDTAELEAIVNHHQLSKTNADHPAQPLKLATLKSEDTASSYKVGAVTLTAQQTSRLIQAAHQADVTVNDVVMALFGRVMQRFSGVPDIALACPTDMRQFLTSKPGMVRIANLTSRYNFSVQADFNDSETDVVAKVHGAMAENKKNQQCFDSVVGLLRQYKTQSLTELQQIVEKNYHVREIAYTNFGIIDAKQLTFKGVEINDFFMTGSFRKAPMFQIAVSTYNQQLKLAFNMDGTNEEFTFGMALTKNIADLINNFALSNSTF